VDTRLLKSSHALITLTLIGDEVVKVSHTKPFTKEEMKKKKNRTKKVGLERQEEEKSSRPVQGYTWIPKDEHQVRVHMQIVLKKGRRERERLRDGGIHVYVRRIYMCVFFVSLKN
jgi:hypothetical protein